MKYILIFVSILFNNACASDKFFYENNQKIILTPANHSSSSFKNVDFYNSKKGILGVSDKLIVKFINTNNLNKYLDEYNLIIIEQLAQNMYLLKTTNKNQTINIANELRKKDDIKFANPDFIRKIKRI